MNEREREKQIEIVLLANTALNDNNHTILITITVLRRNPKLVLPVFHFFL